MLLIEHDLMIGINSSVIDHIGLLNVIFLTQTASLLLVILI